MYTEEVAAEVAAEDEEGEDEEAVAGEAAAVGADRGERPHGKAQYQNKSGR